MRATGQVRSAAPGRRPSCRRPAYAAFESLLGAGAATASRNHRHQRDACAYFRDVLMRMHAQPAERIAELIPRE